jgi:hypothetical protein
MKGQFFTLVAGMVFLASVIGCSRTDLPSQPQEETGMAGLSLPNTYEGTRIFDSAEITHIEMTITELEEAAGAEHSDCLNTVDCETELPSFDFYRDQNGDVCIGYQTTLCDWQGGNAAQAIALYRPGTTHIPDYLMLTSDIDLGYIGPNPGGCYLMTVYLTYSIPGGVHGNFTVDWASAVNYGTHCPPLVTFCGWPLSQPANPFRVHL